MLMIVILLWHQAIDNLTQWMTHLC